VLRVDDDVHVRVTHAERSWTSRVRRDKISGHRPAEPECATGAAQQKENDPQ
jgi:hypothetical protein